MIVYSLAGGGGDKMLLFYWAPKGWEDLEYITAVIPETIPHDSMFN